MGRTKGQANGKPRPEDSDKLTKPREGLRIIVGWQGDGGVYQLDLASEKRIKAVYPEAPVISDGMLLGYDKKRDYNRYHRPHWQPIARMLTGLNDEQIARLGGIQIYDPVAARAIWSWVPETVSQR
jgi:hypothetical protein